MAMTMAEQHRSMPSLSDRIIQGILMAVVVGLGIKAIIQLVTLVVALLRAADATPFTPFAAWAAATLVGFLILYGWERHIGLH